jgi:dihydrolipoamide dehydrogenase
MESYDVVVIGSGPGGYVAALRAGQLGLRTALVERDPWLGGTCLNRGCVPTKHLLHVADLYQRLSRGEGGIRTSDLRLDLAATHAEKAALIGKLRKGIAYLEKRNKVTVLQGSGRLVSAGRVAVEGPDGRTDLEARDVILAAGSRVALPPFVPQHPRVISSDEALDLAEVPERLLILGAGAVGLEFATVFASFGSAVTLAELEDQVAPGEEPKLAQQLARSLKKHLKVKVLTGTRIGEITPGDDAVHVAWTDARDRAQEGTFDAVLVAVGRAANIEDLGLDAAGVRVEGGRVAVDEMYNTSVPGVRAIGDLVATPWLAHVAHHEALIAVDDIAGLAPHPLDADRIPFCIYSQPEYARVGLTEAAATERGLDVKAATFPFSALAKGLIEGGGEGAVKLVSDAGTGELLGLHIIGPRATELVMEGTMAMALEATVEDLAHTIHPHPTLSEGVMEAAMALLERPIHM